MQSKVYVRVRARVRFKNRARFRIGSGFEGFHQAVLQATNMSRFQKTTQHSNMVTRLTRHMIRLT